MSDKVVPPSPEHKIRRLWKKIENIYNDLTVEPAMLLDGLSYSIMIVATENLQMDKICKVNLKFSENVCGDISAFQYQSEIHQEQYSTFQMEYGILTSILPLFFILFVGAWSDKYGRKPPLLAASFCHILWGLCYLLNSAMTDWPVEFIYFAAILDTLGGGTVSFLTSCNAYISDVTKESNRTTRLGIANSIWYLGGPVGTLIGAYIFKYGGYIAVFGAAAGGNLLSFLYILNIQESRGPFAKMKKEMSPISVAPKVHTISNNVGTHTINDEQYFEKLKEEVVECECSNTLSDDQDMKVIRKLDSNPLENNFSKQVNSEDESKPTKIKMLKDLFDYHRIIDSFRSTIKKREGNTRIFILLLILCNILRKLGRGAYIYLFTRTVLSWGPTDYGVWVSYKNTLSAVGSLVAVPVLTAKCHLSDSVLAMIGAFASTLDYVLYGFIVRSREYLVWLAPVGGLLVNSCVIAIRSMLSKLVPSDEIGKVSAVMGALDGLVPMASFSLYTLVYQASIGTFPGLQFFFGAAANILCAFIFLFIISFTKTRSYNVDDIEAADKKIEKKDSVVFIGFKLSEDEFEYKNSELMRKSHTHQITNALTAEYFMFVGSPASSGHLDYNIENFDQQSFTNSTVITDSCSQLSDQFICECSSSNNRKLTRSQSATNLGCKKTVEENCPTIQ